MWATMTPISNTLVPPVSSVYLGSMIGAHTADSNTIPILHPDQLIQVTARIPVTRFNSIKSRGLHRLHAGTIDAWSSAAICLRVVKQHCRSERSRGRGQRDHHLPSRTANATTSRIRCECDCRMLRILAVHGTTRWKEAQQHDAPMIRDPPSETGTNVRSICDIASSCSIRGLCHDLCTRAPI